MTCTATLDNPRSWAQPKLVITDGQGWYPQVIGAPVVEGTDKIAGTGNGERTRYFNQGQSTFFISFTTRPGASLPRVRRP
jgi:hypothetical protein